MFADRESKDLETYVSVYVGKSKLKLYTERGLCYYR